MSVQFVVFDASGNLVVLSPHTSMHAEVLLGDRETLAFASMVSGDLDSDAVVGEKPDLIPGGMQVTRLAEVELTPGDAVVRDRKGAARRSSNR